MFRIEILPCEDKAASLPVKRRVLVARSINCESIAARIVNECRLESLVGNHPQEVCNSLEMLKLLNTETNLAEKDIVYSDFQNAILFVGDTGVGKTAIVRSMIESSGCELIELRVAEICGSIKDGGKNTILELRKVVLERFEVTGKPLIVFIDDIDILVQGYGIEKQKATRQLCEFIEEMSGHPGVFFVFATIIDSSQLGYRFSRNVRTIHIGYPEKSARLEFLNLNFVRYFKGASDKFLNELADNMDGMGFRDMEKVINTLRDRRRNCSESEILSVGSDVKLKSKAVLE